MANDGRQSQQLDSFCRAASNTSESASLVYNGEPPQVSVEAQAQAQSDDIVVTWSASDPGSGLDTCDLEMSTDGRAWESISNDCAGTLTPAGMLAGQPYVFRFTATDNTGNTASAEASAATTAVTKYYYLGGQRVAVREPDGDVNWLHGDHLGSTSLATGVDGQPVSRQLYYPFGEARWASADMPTDFGYTGQRLDGTGLMFYHARYYAPVLGRFIQADTIVPDHSDPQDFNRYSYVRNNPLRYTDPTGHCVFAFPWDTLVCLGIGILIAVPSDVPQYPVLENNRERFLAVAGERGLDPIVLASVVYHESSATERFFGDTLEKILTMVDRKESYSIGIAQMQFSTARMLEEKGYVASKHSYDERRNALLDSHTAIDYAGAYLQYIGDQLDAWSLNHGYVFGDDTRNRLMILGYNQGWEWYDSEGKMQGVRAHLEAETDDFAAWLQILINFGYVSEQVFSEADVGIIEHILEQQYGDQ